jgi:hypothetical protein
MKIKNLLWLAMPLLLGAGCAERYYTRTYGRTETVPAPTSTRSEVRIYPDKTAPSVETAPVTSTVPADEWATAVAVRNMIAGDAYLKGASRNVDIEVIRNMAILRGTVLSDYDRQELAARIAQVPGIVTVDNRLVVTTP